MTTMRSAHTICCPEMQQDSRDDDDDQKAVNGSLAEAMDVDVPLHTQHSHLHQLANRELTDLEFGSDEDNIDELDDISVLQQAVQHYDHGSSSTTSYAHDEDDNDGDEDATIADDQEEDDDDDDSLMTCNNEFEFADNKQNNSTDDSAAAVGAVLSKRELDCHLRSLLQATLTDFSLDEVLFGLPRFVEARSKASEWYSTLIKQAPTLYATQKDSMLSSGAGERMLCRCYLIKHYNLMSCLTEERRHQELVLSSLADRPFSLLFFKLFEFISADEYEFHPVKQALLHLRHTRLRVNDSDQWAGIRALMRQQHEKPEEASNGCSLDCACDCLACSAIAGNSSHMKLLGTCFHQGFAVPQDFEWALCWYSLAAVMGVASALNSIGFMYQEGHGVDADNSQGVLWYFHAAHAGDRTAQYNMACAYYNGCGVSKNHEEAFKWYYLAAKRGDVDAQAAVGDQYFQGDGVEQNYRKAFYWHLLSAKGGNVMAQTTVGHHYYFGWAVERDLRKAFLWHEVAANRGYYQAQFYAGHMLFNGEGCDKNLKRAFSFWMQSARQGCAQAMKALASVFDEGVPRSDGSNGDLLIPRSREKADYWKEQAIHSGIQDSEITYSTSAEDRVRFKTQCRKERNLALVMGLHSRLGQQSPFTHLQQPHLFDRNIIGMILGFSGDSQFPM
eukprot:TRINITY_DN11717_c0_g1_i1.p1 TRINITY_DN11717_c0_g1~~TRINITY_DN11717_c0_g1_i1.p1  ORF type:complete len:672 (-),score=144.13 TRINITY_DN11717_c0_g1_i1:42-2057(-)